MRVLRTLLLALDLVSLVNLLDDGPVLDQLRLLVLALLTLAGLVVVLGLAMIGYALLDQRRPPYIA